MPMIIGASSLFHAVNDGSCDFGPHQFSIFRLPGASLNNRNPEKRVCEMMRKAPTGTEFIIWHDAINNSLSQHPSNENLPLQPFELLEEIFHLQAEFNVIAFVYIRRQSAHDITEYLPHFYSHIFVLNMHNVLTTQYKKLLTKV